jgi:choline-sulfatase
MATHSLSIMLRISCLLLVLSVFAHAKPNVVLVAVDDLNDWIACLDGHPQVQTPHLDRLAARGTLFTNAHCQAPLCNPSRTSLMTGRRPGSSGIYGLAPWFRSVPALRDWVSIPQAFRAMGYHTAITGKIYHTYPPVADRPLEFDEYGPACDFGPFPAHKLSRGDEPERLMDWGVFPENDERQNDWEIGSWAIDFLARDHEKPYLLATGFGRPHVPCFASQKWFYLYPFETLKMPPFLAEDREDTPGFSWYLHWKLPEPRLSKLRSVDEWKPLVRAYLACISFVDSQIGRLMEAIDASPSAGETYVILFSDHGWHLGEKGITGKNSLWERSTRVPLMISGPGLKGGQVCRQPVELLDIFPTLVDLCGLEPVAGLEGLSLRPQLSQPETARRPALTTHNPGNHSVRDIRWRYIRYADGSQELYDHEVDPNEWHNLANDAGNDETMARLASMIPREDKPHAPGSAGRVLQKSADGWKWEGKPITPALQQR